MTTFRNWDWGIVECGQGPDDYFFATFAPSDANRLATLVRRHPLPGFRYYQYIDGWCSLHRHVSTHDLYLDVDSYPKVKENIWKAGQHNIWYYDSIAVCGSDLTIERGLGGLPEYGPIETTLLVALAQSAELTWDKWKVSHAGDGYRSGDVAQGTTAAELLSYLSGDPNP